LVFALHSDLGSDTYALETIQTLIFDDYVWSDQLPQRRDPSRMPKPAIDAFVNIFHRKLALNQWLPLWQFYLQKVAR
jgi:hypothetical protein